MILLRLITWPYVRRHLVRSLLTAAGIVLGVGVFVGMHTANQAVLSAFSVTVDRIAGTTELQVSAGQLGFPEDVLEQVQALPEVRVAVPVIEAVADTGLPGEGSLLILAVDMTGDRSLREYALESGDEAIVDDPLVFLAQPDSLIVSEAFAERHALGVGNRVPMQTMAGEKQFVVRGVMRAGGLAGAFGGNLAIMDVYAAQRVFGRGRRFDRIDLAVAGGVSLAAAREAIERALGPGFEVEPPSSRSAQFESVLAMYAQVVNLTSLFALFIGMFIIYNAFAIAVTERRAEIGILRALGATRRQVRTLFLAEGAVAGAIGSLAGLAFGALIARAMTGYVGGLIEDVYGLAQRAETVSSDPRLLAAAFGMGVATSVAAALLPARQAAAVDPVLALQKGRYQVLTVGENRVRRRAAILLAAVAGAGALVAGSAIVFYAAFVLIVVSALLLTPALTGWATRLVRPVMAWVRPVEGALAADSLLQAPRRTSGTVAALMLSVSLVVALGGVSQASVRSIADWVDSALDPDLFVAASESLTSRWYRFPASMGPELERIPGVAAVQLVRNDRIVYKGRPVMIVALAIPGWAERARRAPIEGDEEAMYRLASAGEGVIVSENFAGLHGAGVGDVLEISAPAGLLRIPVVGVVIDWSDQQGSIFVDRAVFIRWWQDDSVNVFRIYVDPGTPAMDVRAAILERFAGTRRLFVLTNEEVRRYILGLADQWITLAYSQIGVAVLVAVLGIVNTLTVSIIDRRRELGVMRAVGALRRQIRHTMWMEALAIASVGLALGLGFGAVVLHYTLEMSRRDISGQLLPYTYPTAIAAAMLPVMLGAAFVAALWPAEAAVRGSLVEALEYE